MAFSSPFLHPDFKSWIVSLGPSGAKVACSVTYPDGKKITIGDPDLGIAAFTAKLNEKKRKSLEWVVPTDKFIKLKLPLGQFFTKQPIVIKEAAQMLKLFIGKFTTYGTGHCFLWEHATAVDNLKYSKTILQKYKWDFPIIRLSDVLKWHNFKIKSFGSKPSANLFEVPLSWREFCVLLLEIGYDVMDMDTDTLQKRILNPPQIPPVEKLRCQAPSPKVLILEPVLKKMFEGVHANDYPVLQIIEIIPSNIFKTKFTVRLSDGDFWLETKLNSDISGNVKNGDLKKFDLIKLKEYSGTVGCESFCLEIVFRPKSIQMETPGLIRSPVPFHLGPSVSIQKRVKTNTSRAPRVNLLFDEIAEVDVDR
jgi:hypothetical protein